MGSKPTLNASELQAMHDKATKEPWDHMAGLPTNVLDWSGLRVARCDYDGEMDNPQCLNNAALIVALRNSVPAILAMMRKLEVAERLLMRFSQKPDYDWVRKEAERYFEI